MSKVRRTVAALAATLVLGVAAPAGAHSPVPGPDRGDTATHVRTTRQADLSAYARRVLTLTNQRRRSHGCHALRWNGHLRSAAQHHSSLMARRSVLSHLLSGELGLVGRILHAGYRPWRRVAENAAAGYQAPSTVVRAWMRSPGHRRNLLDCRLHDLGVGVVRDRDGLLWWTQDFASH